MILACTRLRMSVMARCAATPSVCEIAKLVIAWTTVAAPAASAIGISRSWRALPITSSMTTFDSAGSTMPARRDDQHQRQADRQATAVLVEQLARFAPGRAGVERLLLAGLGRGRQSSPGPGPLGPGHPRRAGSHECHMDGLS